MVGKHIGVTHVAGSSVKLMGNDAQHGVATAATAFLCSTHDTTPRGFYDARLDELIGLVGKLTGHSHDQAGASAYFLPERLLGAWRWHRE